MPDGKRLAAGAVGDPIQIWDTAIGLRIVKAGERKKLLVMPESGG
jgi:hypothetical protein